MGLCKAVEIFHKRWEVIIVVTEMDGSTTEYIASADSALTGKSQIWFGTRAEYEQELKNVLGS